MNFSLTDAESRAWDDLFPLWSYGLGGDCEVCDTWGGGDMAIAKTADGTLMCEECALEHYHEETGL